MYKHRIYSMFNNFTKEEIIDIEFAKKIGENIGIDHIDYLIKYLEINKIELKNHLIKIYSTEWNIYFIGFCKILLYSWEESRNWRALNTLLKLYNLGYLKSGFNGINFKFENLEKQIFVFRTYVDNAR